MFVQRSGCDHVHNHHLIASPALGGVRNSLTFNTDLRARLSSSRDSYGFWTVQSRHLKIGSQGRLDEVYGKLEQNIVVLAPEDLVGLYSKLNVQVARHT